MQCVFAACILRIFSSVVTGRDARAASEEKAATKQKLLAKLAEKQDKDLDSKSAEEIQAMIDAL